MVSKDYINTAFERKTTSTTNLSLMSQGANSISKLNPVNFRDFLYGLVAGGGVVVVAGDGG